MHGVRAETRSRDIVVLHAIETDLCILSFRGSKLEFRVAHVVNKSCWKCLPVYRFRRLKRPWNNRNIW